MKTQRDNYRTRFEIVNLFLNDLKMRKKTGLAKTKLKQKSGLSPQGFKEYFNRLVKSKLIQEVKMEIKREGRIGRFARTRLKIKITSLGEEYLKKSNLLIIKTEKLNEEYKLNLNEITYTH